MADVTKYSTKDMFLKFEGLLGGEITNLVNNAGVYIESNPLDYSCRDFDIVFETNVKAPFFMSKEYIKYCLNNNVRGNILFTTSNRSLMGDEGPYGMSKAAINNFIEGLAREYIKNGIRINGVALGMTASNINHVDVKGNLHNSGCKGERIILPEEIAQTACFLMSDISRCITGAIVPCDEGDRLR